METGGNKHEVGNCVSLPVEVWGLVMEQPSLDILDLANLRLVCRSWRDLLPLAYTTSGNVL